MPGRRLLLLAVSAGFLLAVVTTVLERLHPVSNLVTTLLVFALTALLVVGVGRIASIRAEATNRAASEGDRLRTAILRAVSHDLRTPLASIKVSATSLLQDDIDWTPQARREFLLTIDEETDRLDRIVGDLLDMSRLDAGAVRTEPSRIDVLASVRNAIGGIDGGGAIAVSHPATCWAWADAVLLERVIANLSENAVRHGGGTARITIGCDGTTVVIDVVDHGPGMAAADMEAAFEPFHRIGDDSPGTGLGLAVARGFVDAMGGRLALGATPGGGVTATIRIAAAGDPTTDRAAREVAGDASIRADRNEALR